jgi:hypothetical protein
MIEPGTKPPPSTRSTSPMPEGVRSASALVTLAIGVSAARPAMARAADGALAAAGRGAATVSTRVFHAPQAAHCPAHLGELAPHCWQR